MRRLSLESNETYVMVYDISCLAGEPSTNINEVLDLAEKIEDGTIPYCLEVDTNYTVKDFPENILLWNALRFLRYSQIRVKICNVATTPKKKSRGTGVNAAGRVTWTNIRMPGEMEDLIPPPFPEDPF